MIAGGSSGSVGFESLVHGKKLDYDFLFELILYANKIDFKNLFKIFFV